MKKYTLYILTTLLFCNFAIAGNMVPLKKSNHSLTMTPKKDLDNVRICALRVEFQQDDNDVTTGDGTFLYEAETADTLNSRFKVDPVPHNRAYFYDHIRSLANFYDHVSNGNLTIDPENSEVYPLEDSETFTLSREMDYYHPFLEEDSIDVRLAELFVEAVTIADESVNFSDYDVVVIFHAGVGQDFSFDLDITPYDIPSAYLNADDIKKAMGDQPDFQGIAVDDGNTFLNECIILPETQNHTLYERWDEVFNTDSAFDYQIGLNGTFAFMFGFYLGIPGMYNTETGDPGAGRWEMMDQGSVNLNGLIPAMPNAWIRKYMGWIDPVEAKTSTPVNLAHGESASDTLAWKIQIDEDEYFLVENRNNFLRPGWNLDSIRNAEYEAGPEDANFPSVLPLIKDSIDAEISEETGVLLSVPRYDVGLPGSGLLIWHIDETVINANLSTNSVNNDRERKGVHLEEGDGAVDIGFPAANMFSDVHNGWGYDAWFATNEGFWDVNKDFYEENEESFVGFTEYTFPNTNSNDRMSTGIRIDSIGAAGERMNFYIGFANKSGSFPVDLGSEFKTMTFCDFDEDTNEDLIIVSDKIYLYNGYGDLIASTDYFENYQTIDNLEVLYVDETIYLVFEFGTRLKIQTYELDDDGEISREEEMELVNTEITSNLQYYQEALIFGANTATGYHLARFQDDEMTYYEFDYKINKIGFGEQKFYYLLEDGQVWSSTIEINSINIREFELIVSEKADNFALAKFHDDLTDAVVTTDRHLFLIENISSDDFEVNKIPLECRSNPVIADINGDGTNDIVVATANKIYAFDENLILLANFPVDIPNQFQDNYFGESVYAMNLDGNPKSQEIVAFIENAGIITFDHKGDILSHMAMITPLDRFSGLYNLEDETYFLSIGNGQMDNVMISENSLTEQSWGKQGIDNNSYYYSYHPVADVPEKEALLNKKKTFCWPNPVEENESYIRYFVTEDCDVTVNIFNMAGQHVRRFNPSEPQVNQFNEITWNVADVQSGVYFAIVKAEAGGTTETKTVKIMVIK